MVISLKERPEQVVQIPEYPMEPKSARRFDGPFWVAVIALIALVVATMFIFAAWRGGEVQRDLNAQVDGVIAAWVDADDAALASIYADDAVFVDTDRVSYDGLESITAHAEELSAGGLEVTRVSDVARFGNTRSYVIEYGSGTDVTQAAVVVQYEGLEIAAQQVTDLPETIR